MQCTTTDTKTTKNNKNNTPSPSIAPLLKGSTTTTAGLPPRGIDFLFTSLLNGLVSLGGCLSSSLAL